ncbi:Ces3, partial [Cordylochernes scorpioides]
MDQVAALHWLQENILEFGGDPDNVTVLGHGHGAACVHLLMVSPMAKGLFQRSILQSGSALSPWAMARHGVEYAREAAKQLNCSFRHSGELLSCLRSRTVDQLLAINLSVPAHLSAFGPSIDEVVVTSDYASLLGKARGDILLGVTRTEAPFLFTKSELRDGITTDRRDRLLRTLVRNLYSFHLVEIFLTIVNEYTDWARADAHHPLSVLEGASDALGDALVVAPLIRSGNLHPNPRTYLYVFTHPTEQGDYPERLGCVNGEDLPYVFGAPLQKLSIFPSNFSKAEISLSETVMSYWTNFVKT